MAILSENRPEWLLADYAVLAAGGVVVPLYTSLAPAQLEYILSNAGARAILVSTPALLDRIQGIRSRLPELRLVVAMDPAPSAEGVLPFRELMARGRERQLADPDAFARLSAAARPEDPASIIYTSGTTGPPRGALLTHGGLAGNVVSIASRFGFTPADRALSFLPLCHIFERAADFAYFMMGVTIVHVSLEDLLGAFPAIRPTIIASVPRLYEKLRDRVRETVAASPAPRRALVEWALNAGREARLAPLLTGRAPSAAARLRWAAARRLVLSRLHAALGGRLRIAISGGAALPREVQEFFVTIGLPIVEGYGLTECGVVAVNHPGRIRPGTVGPPVDGFEVRIAEDGEILLRGPSVMRCYFRDPEGTASAMDGDWLRTGDVGALDAGGCLALTDRKKDILITSGGKNVAPQPLESALRATGLVLQALVVGNGRKFVAALLVPDRDALRTLCARLGLGEPGIEAAVERPEVVAAFGAAIREATRDFAPYEQIRRFTLLPRELTLEAGEITPTLKIRRRVVEERYADVIEAMYREP